MKSNKKLTPLEKEKLLDQEEIIEFYYHDKESKTKILIKDKRKIKVYKCIVIFSVTKLSFF